jgi:hypothetical protein
MKLFRYSIVLALTLVTTQNASALDQIIKPFTSARSTAMGGVRYTTGLYEENFFSNPARAAANPVWRVDIFNQLVEANSSLIQNMDQLSGGGDTVSNAANTAGSNNHVRLQTILPAFYFPQIFSTRTSFAIGLIQSTQADISLRRNLSVDPTAIIDVGPAFTFARRMMKENRLTVGFTGHLTYRAATKENFSTIDYLKLGKFDFKRAAGEGMHYDFDIGSTYTLPWKPKGWRFQPGFAINNILGGKYKNIGADFISGETGKPPTQPTTFNFGTSAMKPGFLKLNNAVFAFEVQDIGNNKNGSLFRLIHTGTEVKLKDWFALRAGIGQGYLSAGLGFDLPLFKIDLTTYGEELALNSGEYEDRRYALRVGISL